MKNIIFVVISLLLGCQNISNGEYKSSTKSSLSSECFVVQSETVNLSNLRRVKLTLYKKGTKYTEVVKTDTIGVDPASINGHKKYWIIAIHSEYANLKDISNFDIEIKLIGLERILRYSDIKVEQMQVYGGSFSNLKSYMYNEDSLISEFTSNNFHIFD